MKVGNENALYSGVHNY